MAVGRDEEAAFWLLAALVERICFPGSFGHTLSGCHVEMRTLQGRVVLWCVCVCVCVWNEVTLVVAFASRLPSRAAHFVAAIVYFKS